MELEKREYENILALLHRVEIKGLNEAREVAVIAAKLEHKIQDFNKAAASPVQLETQAALVAVPAQGELFPLHKD